MAGSYRIDNPADFGVAQGGIYGYGQGSVPDLIRDGVAGEIQIVVKRTVYRSRTSHPHLRQGLDPGAGIRFQPDNVAKKDMSVRLCRQFKVEFPECTIICRRDAFATPNNGLKPAQLNKAHGRLYVGHFVVVGYPVKREGVRRRQRRRQAPSQSQS